MIILLIFPKSWWLIWLNKWETKVFHEVIFTSKNTDQSDIKIFRLHDCHYSISKGLIDDKRELNFS